MNVHAYALPYDDALIVDEEFDRVDIGFDESPHPGGLSFPGTDLAWDDQLDNGEEMSL